MAHRIDLSTLQATSMDIINTIRMNANPEYQSLVPEVKKEIDIPKVGEVLLGYPAMANQFLTQLMNRIALVLVRSATFNNPYAELKKGYLDYGETVEEVFVELAKVRDFSAEKAAKREFARTLPDVRTAFHVMNWQVQYPTTVNRNDLRKAFLSAEGVYGLVDKIIQSCYTANNYDEFLLFKYLLIKGVNSGAIKPTMLPEDTVNAAAKNFRGLSSKLTFLSTQYNSRGVHTSTPRNDQFIFMDADYNAEYDVDNLAAAFNMDKADFMGRLLLIDNWHTFDQERFAEIQENTTMLEPITQAELAAMKNIRAIICDREWFQVYDNTIVFDDTKVSSGLYWNYNLTVEKTISYSPFSNAVAVFAPAADIKAPEQLTVEILQKSTSEEAVTLSLGVDNEAGIFSDAYSFVQTEALTTAGIGIHPYGGVLIPPSQVGTDIALELVVDGIHYYAQSAVTGASKVGDTITFTQNAPASLSAGEGNGVTTVRAAKASK